MFIFFDSINNNFTSVLNVILGRWLIANKTVFCLHFRLIMCRWFHFYPFNLLTDAIVRFASEICILKGVSDGVEMGEGLRGSTGWHAKRAGRSR